MTRFRKVALAVAGLAALLASLSAADARGLRRFLKISKEIEGIEEKNRLLAKENAGLKREIEALSGDPKALERAAREDLGLVRPNEVVFTFE